MRKILQHYNDHWHTDIDIPSTLKELEDNNAQHTDDTFFCVVPLPTPNTVALLTGTSLDTAPIWVLRKIVALFKSDCTILTSINGNHDKVFKLMQRYNFYHIGNDIYRKD